MRKCALCIVLCVFVLLTSCQEGNTQVNINMSPENENLVDLATVIYDSEELKNILSFTGSVEELNKDYVRAARAKGLSERAVIYKHAGKNAIIPVITLASIQFIRLLGGTVIVETIFDYPGIGRFGVLAAQQLDIAGILGFSLMVAVLFVLGNLLSDILYTAVDPRIRLD